MVDEKMSNEQAKAHILYKLMRRNCWGAKHTELIHVRAALPSYLRENAEDLARELANEGFLTWLKKTNQIHISLNSRKKKEILDLISKFNGTPNW